MVLVRLGKSRNISEKKYQQQFENVDWQGILGAYFLVLRRETRDPYFDPTHETSGSSDSAEAAKNSEEIAKSV